MRTLRDRATNLALWLESSAAGCQREQRHLEKGTPERAYWHYGYWMALRDTVGLLERHTGTG
jgi:hypothetical protein